MKTGLVVASVVAVLLAAYTGFGFWMLSGTKCIGIASVGSTNAGAY